jgi:hypothetical protein
MTFRRSWKRVGGDDPYWLSKSGLRLKFLDDGEVLFSDGLFPDRDAAGPAIPDAFSAVPAGAAARGFLPKPSLVVSRVLGPAAELIRLPIAELAFSLEESDGAYAATLLAAAPSPREARALASVLRLARLARLQDDADPRRRFLGKLLAADPTVEGTLVFLRADGIGASELAALLPELPDDALLNP